MANGVVVREGWSAVAGFRAVRQDVFAGILCSILTVAYSLSYAALIFSGPLEPWLACGVSATFLSSALAAAAVAWRSSIPFAVAGPDSSTSAVVAALVATLVARLAAEGHTALIEPTLLLVALATGVTGLLLWALGMARAGRAIRYIPYPVIGGFLGATGVLMILGAIQVITDHRLTPGSLASFATGPTLAKLAAGLAVALVLQRVLVRWPSAYALPGVLIAAVIAAHLALPLLGIPLATAQADGWMFAPQPAAALGVPWSPQALAGFPWAALPWLAGDVLGVVFVAVVSLMLNATGIEIATRHEVDIERELRALGLANLAASALGGYLSCLSVSRTALAHAAGASGRITGATVAMLSAVMLMADPALLGIIPKFALGGLLFVLGAGLAHRWLVRSARQLRLGEFLSLLAIALIIVQWGFIAGVGIGVVIGCATFAVSASRVNAIKFSFDGSEYRSSLDRSAQELAILAEHGRALQGMALQSYLFFGSANRLYRHVKALLAREPACRFLLFDFRLVTGVDSSATHSFAQIRQAAAEAGVRLVLVNLTPELQRAFRTPGFEGDVVVAPNLDRALESCEEQIIEAHRAKGNEAGSLGAWLGEALGSAANAECLVAHCRRIEVEAGAVIAAQGGPPDSMHFIVEGRIGILVDLGDGRTVRVRSLGPHTTIGEMGLITGRPRSATIQAETASVLYVLSAADYAAIKQENPAAGQALLSYVIAVMAERLSYASRVIGVLQR